MPAFWGPSLLLVGLCFIVLLDLRLAVVSSESTAGKKCPDFFMPLAVHFLEQWKKLYARFLY